MFEVLALYLVAINLGAFAAFRADKRAAEQAHRRIPERTLLWLAAFGGTPAAFAGQQILRHKTRKQPFGAWLWMIAGAQAVVLAALAVQALRAR